jgi:hypothetical protein
MSFKWVILQLFVRLLLYEMLTPILIELFSLLIWACHYHIVEKALK